MISAQAHAGLNDDELEWKLASSDASDPYGLAKRERERAEGDYDRLMWEQSKLEAMARLGADPAAERALGDLRDAANRSLEARRARRDERARAEADRVVAADGARAAAAAAAAADAEAARATMEAEVAAMAAGMERDSMAREDDRDSIDSDAADGAATFDERGRLPFGGDASATALTAAVDLDSVPATAAAALVPAAEAPEEAAPPEPPRMAELASPPAKRLDLAGALSKAAAGRGGGGNPLMAALAGGRGGGGRPKKSVASALAALRKALGRGRDDAAKLPVALPEFAAPGDALAGVVAVAEADVEASDGEAEEAPARGWWWDRWDDEARDAAAAFARAERADAAEAARDARVAAACVAALEHLAAYCAGARAALGALKGELRDVEEALDRWRTREADAPNRGAALAAEERAWAARERAENTFALALMRTLVPPGVAAETGESLRQRAARVVATAAANAKKKRAAADGAAEPKPERQSDRKAYAVAAAWGGYYTYDLADRLKARRPLHWVQAHPDDLENANFLNGAGAEAFKNLGDYDVVELRAIYASLPPKFGLDASGAKAAWRRCLVERLQLLVARDRGDAVPAGWDGLKGERRRQRLPPLPDKLRRHPAYHYPSAADLDAAAARHAAAKRRRDDRRQLVADLEAKLEELRAERDAAFADARSEYLQQQYGRQLLRELSREADEAFKKTAKALGAEGAPSGARADYARAVRAVEDASPSEDETRALRKLLEKHSLHVGDGAADDRDLAALRKRALDRAGVADDAAPRPAAAFADPPRGRLVRGPFDPWPALKRADRAPVAKKLSDAEEAALRRQELERATATRKAAPPGPAAARLFGAPEPEPAARRPAAAPAPARQASSKVLAPVAPKSRRLSLLSERSLKAAEGDGDERKS